MRANSRNHFQRFGGWSAGASGVIAIFGVVPFVSYPFGLNFPGLNDDAALVQYLLALPLTWVLYRLTRAHAAIGSLVAMLIGLAGILLFTVVQAVWVIWSMETVVYLVVIGAAMLMIGAWLVITGIYLRHATEPLRRSLLMSILAATYFAYPVWAIWLCNLLVADRLTAVTDPNTRGETANFVGRCAAAVRRRRVGVRHINGLEVAVPDSELDTVSGYTSVPDMAVHGAGVAVSRQES